MSDLNHNPQTGSDADLESAFRTALKGRAAGVAAPGDFAPLAIARRRRDQRAKGAIGAVAFTAVLALAVPALASGDREVPVLPASTSGATGSVTTDPTPSTPPTTPPTTTATTTATAAAESTKSAQKQASSASSWAAGDRLHVGDRTIQLEPGTVVASFAVVDGGRIILDSSVGVDGPAELEVLDPTGRTLTSIEPWERGPGFAWSASPDGAKLLVSDGASLTIYATDGRKLATRPDARAAQAIVGGLAYASAPAASSTEPSLEWNYLTDEVRELPPGLRAVTQDGQRAAGYQIPPTKDGAKGCWVTYQLASPEDRDEHCVGWFFPMRFSEQGTYLIGGSSFDDGRGGLGNGVKNLAVVRVSDGSVVVGAESGDDQLLGWSLQVSADETSFLVSRRTTPLSDERVPNNTLARCTFDAQCDEVAPEQQGPRTWLGHYTVAR
ncbi:hypothetical protein OO014_07760 [Intrasporangium calvum]|uniref:Uncharacterized protein n=1 Tax=Intrasporangium calvum TaxID=53358 RepID=A0ABT5GGV3_9MICO|nr:hypothetical protein [Intrasporangium calvum]MDC5697151.1 hypothetical protein [Intrasporangium calvum]